MESVPPLRKQYTYSVSSPVAVETRRRSAARLADKHQAGKQILGKPKPQPGETRTTMGGNTTDGLRATFGGVAPAAPAVSRPAGQPPKKAAPRSFFAMELKMPGAQAVRAPASAREAGGPRRGWFRAKPKPAMDEEKLENVETAMDQIGYSSAASGFTDAYISTSVLCKELDTFESEVTTAGRLGNDYKTIHGEPIRMLFS